VNQYCHFPKNIQLNDHTDSDPIMKINAWHLCMLHRPVILPPVYSLLNCSSMTLVNYQNPSQGRQSCKECLYVTDTASKDVSSYISIIGGQELKYILYSVI